MARTSIVLGVLVLASYAAFGLPHASARTDDAVMSLTVSSGGSCVAATCVVPIGGMFALAIGASAPPDGGYIGIQTELDYSELVANGGLYMPRAVEDEIVWPDSAKPLRLPGLLATGFEGAVNHASATAVGPPFPTSTFAGTIVELWMVCSDQPSSNELGLIPLDENNANGSAYKGAVPSVSYPNLPAKSEPLTVICNGEILPPPSTTPNATATPMPTTTPAPLLGDANCDRIINSIDALLMLQLHAALLDELPCRENGDVNGDGRINAVDATLVLQYGAPICHLFDVCT